MDARDMCVEHSSVKSTKDNDVVCLCRRDLKKALPVLYMGRGLSSGLIGSIGNTADGRKVPSPPKSAPRYTCPPKSGLGGVTLSRGHCRAIFLQYVSACLDHVGVVGSSTRFCPRPQAISGTIQHATYVSSACLTLTA